MTRHRVGPWVSLAVVVLGLQLGWLAKPAAAQDGKPIPTKLDTNTLLEPFDAPTLQELDAKADWVDQPVEDPLELLQAQQAKEPPLATLQQALSLVNNSDENNAKILSALGRLPKSDAEVNWDATFNHHMRGDIKSTNPLLANSKYEFDLESLVDAMPFGFDWNLRPFALKERVVSWQTSKDHMIDKVVLRSDWTWSDGRPVTAHDIVFSFQMIMNKKVPATVQRTQTQDIRWVQAYDDHTVVYFHKQPLATNVWNVSFPLLPKHIYEKSLPDDYTLLASDYHVKYENEPVYAGPYVISSRSRGQETVLTRRESYYMFNGKQVRPKPYFKEIRLRVIEDTNTALLALKSGRIDDMELTPEQWVNQTNGPDFNERNTKVRGTEWTYFYFGWNCKSPFFEDVRVRKAMSYAFDHEEMLKLNYGLYERCNGIFHPSAWMAPKKPLPLYKQDLDKAEDLLDAAGWKDTDNDGIRDKMIDGKKVPFEFTVLVHNSPDRIKICTLLKQNLKQIGISCNIRPLEMTVLFDTLDKHTFDAYYAGWGTGTDPDTNDNIWSTQAISDGRNYPQYATPEIDKLFQQGKVEFDQAKRAEIYAKIDELIYDAQPVTFLFHYSSFFAFNKKLRGYRMSPRSPLHYSPGIMSLWEAAQ